MYSIFLVWVEAVLAAAARDTVSFAEHTVHFYSFARNEEGSHFTTFCSMA